MQTPLNIAASIGNDALVVMLLDHGAGINGVVQENWGPSRMHTQPAVVDALLSGHESTVRLLLERGSDLQGPHIAAGGLVSYAVDTGHLAMLKLLAEFGADMNIPYAGVYPLYKAVCSTQLSTDIVRFLLDYGAEIAPIDDGHGRLMKEVLNRGTIDTARLLLERGAVYPPDEFRSAIYFGTLDTIRLLIEYGMKPDIEWLNIAIRTQRLNVLQLLLEGGFDLNTRDSGGCTVLHYAVGQCGFEWPTQRIEPLPCGLPYFGSGRLVRHINVIPPQNVSTPCNNHDNERDDAKDILRYLIHMGADVNAMDGQGRTPLYLARKYAPAVEQILLDNGANSERMFLKEEESDDD
ncbi:ankyrin repeat-containing domain protein [Penicillium lagena]|uniref:ankyrin repeat-containing domain protein n=1 Tax=Penicillium lagena TaxID=94218 RepID=UPI00253FD33A|nr:ankyrin repeat-containing domain protein [Penicillium lagena]KAJ5613173.1 ankyrin repeat-containing domain protein [Penicillium lagena]